MNTAPCDVLIYRHYKERKSKCSLQPLVGREGFAFRSWKPDMEIHAPGHILLEIDAPEIGPADAGSPLLLLDSTWRLLPRMRASVRGEVLPRSLPAALRTAYPRRSKFEEDPTRGLASIEALYAALRLMGHRDDSLLDEYHWREPFLEICESSL